MTREAEDVQYMEEAQALLMQRILAGLGEFLTHPTEQRLRSLELTMASYYTWVTQYLGHDYVDEHEIARMEAGER